MFALIVVESGICLAVLFMTSAHNRSFGSDLLFSRVFSIVSILFAPKNSTLFFYTFSKSIEYSIRFL